MNASCRVPGAGVALRTLFPAALAAALVGPAAAQAVTIDFDQLTSSSRLSSALFPEAIFSPLAPANGVMTYSTPVASSAPNFICSSVDETITCLDPLAVDFPLPVRNLTFFAVGVNHRGRTASVRVFENGALSAVVHVLGTGHGADPVLVDLSAFVDVTRIELFDLDDPYGIGWDDFSFEIQHAPVFDPPSPCGQTLVAYVGQPLAFRVSASDVVASEVVRLDAGPLPAGVQASPGLPRDGNPAVCDFTWTPHVGDLGTHTLSFVASDGVLPPVSCSFDVEVLCPSQWSNFGSGVAGTGGLVPRIEARCFVTGEPTWIDVSQGLGQAKGCILLGETTTSFPVFGGTLYVLPSWTHTHMLSGTGLPGEGTFSLPLDVPPSPALKGLKVYFQAGYMDPAAVQGVVLTPALEVTVG